MSALFNRFIAALWTSLFVSNVDWTTMLSTSATDR